MERFHNHFSPEAIQELSNILNNDYTLSDKFFRIKIDNKGCSGFDYHLGFSEELKDDVKVTYTHDDFTITYVMDPFTAFYCESGLVLYEKNDETQEEGFIYKNLNEKKYYKKFYQDENLVPEPRQD